MNSEQENTFIIPPNVFDKRKFDFRVRNIKEGLVAAAVVVAIICAIPFVFKVKVIVSVVLGISVFGAGVIGIKKQSITEWLINKFKSARQQKKYSFRRLEYGDRKENTFELATTQKSYAEKLFEIAKEKFGKE